MEDAEVKAEASTPAVEGDGRNSNLGDDGGKIGALQRVYHERQRMQFCLLHALNNLLQEKDCFTRVELDAIAENLALSDPEKGFWTPLSVIFKSHHNAITGNYDVNVLIAALESKKKKVVWHDHRNGASSIDLDGQKLVGLVLNVSIRKFGGLWTNRHWVAIKNVGGVWYNLDSDFPSPKQFQDREEVVAFLDCIMSKGGELLIIWDDGS